MKIMTILSRTFVARSQVNSAQSSCWLPMMAAACLAFLLPEAARAAFHFWDVTEVYSSADGSVQFIELTSLSSGQQNLATFGATIRSTNSSGVNTFSFPTNLPSFFDIRTCILGTSNLASIPGGVTPNYIIPANFVRSPVAGGNAAVIFDPISAVALYATLPTDGDSALLRSGGSMIIVSTNSPKNFSGQSNTIVPVKFLSANVANDNFVMSFRTATGVNGGTGPNYAVEALSAITSTNWVAVSNVTGNGTTRTVGIPFSPFSNKFFRLRSP